MTPKKKIKFLIDVEVEAQGNVTFKAKAGEVVELSTASANRWLKRNMAAVHIQAEKPKTVKANAKPKAAAKTTDK